MMGNIAGTVTGKVIRHGHVLLGIWLTAGLSNEVVLRNVFYVTGASNSMLGSHLMVLRLWIVLGNGNRFQIYNNSLTDGALSQ